MGRSAPVQLVLATHNAHKVDELRRILGARLDGIELLGYDGPDAVEDGRTFAENSLIKARAAAGHTGLPAVADDSGICVDALGGAPGIHSARYAGTRVDEDNRRKLLEELAGVTDRTAHFECAAALVTVSPSDEHVETGLWPGTVLAAPVGSNGFGYDPVFRPVGYQRSSAQLTADEKNAISHRAIAFGRLIDVVRASLLG